MNCERCGKRLTRKGVRQIGGQIVCANCMFGRDSDRSGEAMETRSGSTEGESAGLTEGKASPKTPPEETHDNQG